MDLISYILNKNAIAKVEVDVEEVKEDLSKAEQDIVNIKEDITQDEQDISDIKGDISTIQGDITDIKEDIGQDEQDISDIKGDITTIQNDISDINTELAKKVDEDDLGSSAYLDAPEDGHDAAAGEVVVGSDSRLTDSRDPNPHTHTLANITDAGSAAAYDIPVMGDALADEVVMGDDSRLTDTRDPNPHTHDLSDITDAGTAASKNVAASGDASTMEVVMGNDSRLTDDRDPNPHTHEVADITDFPSLGTASAKNVPSSGDAGNDEVVLGNDSRLSDARPSSDVTNTYSSSGTVPVSGKAVATALGTLDVSSVGGNNKYISEISETDGKISATAGTIDTAVTKNSNNLVTSGAVWSAIDDLPEPMVFKGSLGSGGTISALPVDGSATVGDTYKVITDGTYAGQDAKVGDLFSCLTKTSSANTWEYFPSGDEPSGTVISVKIEASSPIVVDDDSAITTSGTRVLSHANSGVTAGTYTSVTVDAKGHVTDGSNPDISYNDLVDKPTLGTAAALDVPASGNASNGQVVKGDDSRLTDARNAADVYAWAKEENKPSYTKSEVGLGNVDNTSDADKPISTATQTALNNKVDKIDGKGLSTNDYTTTEKNKLAGIESGAEVNIQADWNEDNNTSDAFINNKPTSMPASDVYSWAKAENKPSYTASEVGAVPAYVAGGTNNITALQSLFQDHNIAKSVGVSARLEHGSHSMAFGWFLDGYDYNHAYGGWFISDYGTPSWVGVNNGEWTDNKYFAFRDEIPDISGKLDKTGGTLTGELISQDGGIWIQGGSAAGGNYYRLITVGGMPAEMQYNQGKRGTRLYSNGIAFCDPYNGNNNNDSAWIRHIEETPNTGILEIAVGDDGANEVVAVRRYNTNNNVANEILLFDENGYTIYGTSIAINPNQGGNYNEGLRINKASNGWSTLTMGGAAGSVIGTGDNVWFLGCNASVHNHRFMIGHNSGSSSGTYWYVDSSDQISPYLRVGGDIRADRYIYANYLNQNSYAETPTIDSYWFYCNSDGFLRKSSRANLNSIIAPYEANLQWGGRHLVADYSPIDAAMVPELGANRFAFIPGNAITVEYTRDGGSTWIDYEATALDKTGLFSTSTNFIIGKADSANKATENGRNYQLRVTIDTPTASLYTTLNKFVIYCSTNGSWNSTCQVQGQLRGSSSMTDITDEIDIGGWSGYNVINVNFTAGNSYDGQYNKVRFIFRANGGDPNYVGLVIMKIRGYGGVGWSEPSTMAYTGCLFSYDAGQNAIFPASLTASNYTATSRMSLSAGLMNISSGTTTVFADGIAISNPTTKNDQGWIRVLGTGESDTVMEIATGDDGGAGEAIVARQYNTSSTIVREAKILDASGNTSFPGQVSIGGIAKFASNMQVSNIPQFSGSPPYILGIEAFASGGDIKWQNIGSIKLSDFSNDLKLINVTNYDGSTYTKQSADGTTMFALARYNSPGVNINNSNVGGAIISTTWHSSGYNSELFIGMGDGPGLYYRGYDASRGSYTDWQALITSSNIASYSVTNKGNLANYIGTSSPASTTTTYWENNIGILESAMGYNEAGLEYSIFFNKGANANYGSILKWGYNDTYLYILRKTQGAWRSADWEKVSAGWADAADYATCLCRNDTITYGSSRLQWYDLSGSNTAVDGPNPHNPTNDWYHHIQCNHSNGAGYYIDFANCFHEDGRFYYRRVASGTAYDWVRIWDSSSLTNLNQLTNGPGYITSSGSCASATKATQDSDGNAINTTYLKLSGGTLTGTLTSRSITPSSSNTYNIGSSTEKFNNIYVNYTNTDYVFADNGVVGSYYYVNDDYPIILFQETTSSGEAGTYNHETYLRKKHIGVDVGPSTYYDLYLPEASGTLAITDDIARYYASGTSSTTSGSWKSGGNASITITVPGTYLFIAWALFSTNTKTQGIRFSIGNSPYNQNIVNMNYNQSITMSTFCYMSVSANTVAKTQVYTSISEMVPCFIVAIRLV